MTHMSEIQAALETVHDRRQQLIAATSAANPSGVDSTQFEAYRQEIGLDNAVAEAESLVAALRSSLDDVRSLLEEPPRVIEQLCVDGPKDSSTIASEVTQQSQPFSYSQFQCNVIPPPVNSTRAVESMELAPTQAQVCPSLQMGKLMLDPFCGDITQFHRFWCTFELAVHNNANIPPVYKFLYLQSLLKGEAQLVLQDLDPRESSYEQLVMALKRRYDRPHKTRALLHKQLQQLPPSRCSGSDLRSTWFRISGILHGLCRYEDFRNVLPLLDLVKSKFPPEIREKLHDFHIISSKEKYEESTTLNDSLVVNSTSRSRSPPRTRTLRPDSNATQCCFCNSRHHSSTRCPLEVPATVRRNLVRAYDLCWKCIRSGHSVRTCQYPPCHVCGGQHHSLLCDSSLRGTVRGRTPTRNRQSNRGNERIYGSSRHRSPSPRYPSRSPSRDGYRSRSLSYSGRSRSSSTERYRRDGNGLYQLSFRRQSRTPPRVGFHSPARDNLPRRRNGSPFPSQHHTVESENEIEALQSCLENTTLLVDKHTAQTALMLVQGKAYSRSSERLKQIILLLDSGAQSSFITTRTVRRLGLERVNTRPRTFITFGGQSTTEVSSKVRLSLIDSLMEELVVELTTKQVITTVQHPPHITTEDEQFILDHGLQLPSCRNAPVLPDILIGMDPYNSTFVVWTAAWQMKS